MQLWNDIRFGVRTLRKSPGFTATAVVTLALGIGATTATFSVADAMLWKPVVLPDMGTLVAVGQEDPGDQNSWSSVAPADMEDIERDNTALAGLASWTDGLANLAGPGQEPERVFQALVTVNFFDIMGIHPARGRGFETGEDQPGRDREVILSDRLWRRRYGADPSIVGKTIRLDDRDNLVVGIMPPRFQFPLPTEIWSPLALTPEARSARRSRFLTAMGRLKPGHSIREVQAQLAATAARLEKLYPNTNRDRHFKTGSAHRFLVGEYNLQYMTLLFYAVLFVLLIACVNVANLQFARATGRFREIAVRRALGAGRRRLVTQLVTESVVLSVGGAAVALLVAAWGLDLIRAGMPPEIERFVLGWDQIHLDGRALGFALAAAVVSGMLSGIVPAWQMSRPATAEFLKEGSRGSSAGRARHRLRSLLVGSEVALTVVLLVGAGLMVRGFRTLVAAGAALEPDTLLTLRLSITESRYAEPHAVAAFYQQVLQKTGDLPGVRGVAAALFLPYTMHSSGRNFAIEGRPPEAGVQPSARYQAVNADFFQVLHVPLRAGRFLGPGDGAEAPLVAAISERAAQRWWPGEPPPLGRRIRIESDGGVSPWITIVGVVGDLRHDVYDRMTRPTLYVPFEQAPSRWMDIGIRTAGDPLRVAQQVMAAIHSVDAEQPISDVRTMAKLIADNATGLNYVAAMMAIFGALALVLSSVGVYGVMAYLVSEQTHEIGIRMALGAPRQTVLGMVFRRGMTTALAGLALGMAAAYGLARLLASLVFGVDPGDAVTFVGIPLALILSAALALYVPARRAMRIDPMAALRHE